MNNRPAQIPAPYFSLVRSLSSGRSRLDEVLCILEVLASMTLAPEVADAALPPAEFLTQVRAVGRAGEETGSLWVRGVLAEATAAITVAVEMSGGCIA